MCGYDTCREKAIAVYQNKAVIEICQPLLAKKSEDFSDILFDNAPNGLIVLNERLEMCIRDRRYTVWRVGNPRG